MTIIILHLSDIHIKNKYDPILTKAKEIAQCTFHKLSNAAKLFIVISGDIAFSGTKEQYDLAKKFFDDIQMEIELENDISVSFIMSPGNHDNDFSMDNQSRKIIIKSLKTDSNPIIDGTVIETCTEVQRSFFDFRREFESNEFITDDKLVRESTIDVNGAKIKFISINVSWLSEKNEQQNLYFPVGDYDHLLSDKNDLDIVVLHHPLNWFNQSAYRTFREFVRKKGDIVISGHEHFGNVGLINDTESGESAFVEGCVLQENSSIKESSFNVIEIDLISSQFSSTKYEYKNDAYVSKEDGSWHNFHNLPAKSNNNFDISKKFLEKLDDPGSLFRHPSKTELKLDDIFIFQDLKRTISTDDAEKNHISSHKLLTFLPGKSGVFLEGEEKVGKTSLLYQFFLRFHECGKIPIYIDGEKITKYHPSDIDKLIKEAVTQQYGSDRIEKFNKQSTSIKVLLLDNFDSTPIKSNDLREIILNEFNSRFCYMILTVSDLFEFREIIKTDTSKCNRIMDHYRMQTFGYSLRSKLAQKWFNLGRSGEIDDTNFTAMCDNAERLMETAMTRAVIPSIPLYLLTLLQSIEAGRSGEFQESALGDYYHYLLTEAFLCSGVKKDQLREHFQYVTQLAAEFHIIGQDSLSERELRRFNEKFSKKWHTVDFSERITLLQKTKILYRGSDDYKFRYPYIYYFLKGRYLSGHLSDSSTKEYINHCCKHLYVRDYANTILFLSHHTNNDFLLDNISLSMSGLFNKCNPLSFGDDTLQIRKLIDDSPKLIYTESNPSENREKVNNIKDEFDDGCDGLSDDEEKDDQLSIMAQLTMLFKTNEILGQILKNQYATIERGKKRELLKDLFNGPLRALKDFYDYLGDNTDALVNEIEATIFNKLLDSERNKNRDKPITDIGNTEKRNKIARAAVANVVRMLSVGFILKTAKNANSEKLLEDIEDTVSENNTLSFKLIELAILLDSPKSIPKIKLSSLYDESKSDPVLKKILHVLIMNRLYMFETKRKDMEWLSNNTDINIKSQQIAVYGSKSQRLLN